MKQENEMKPEHQEFANATDEITAIVTELYTARAAREGRQVEQADILDGAAGLLGAAYSLVKMAGAEHMPYWVDALRSHAQKIEDDHL